MRAAGFLLDRARVDNGRVGGRRLTGCDVQVLSDEEERFDLQVTCAQCQVTFIVVLAIAGGAVEDIASIDADSAAAPVVAREPISVDEMIDRHLMPQTFQGTLTERLQQHDHTRG